VSGETESYPDFTGIKKNWQEHYPGMSFEKLVAMYVNDCLGYLSKKDFKSKDSFDDTENQELIYYGLRDLKDSCMRISGEEPLDWMA